MWLTEGAAVVADLLPPNEKEGMAPSVAAAGVADVPNEKAAPVEAAGGAAVPNENPVVAAEDEAGAVEPNEKPPVDANDATGAGAAEPNENAPLVLGALPNEKAGAEEAAEAAGC